MSVQNQVAQPCPPSPTSACLWPLSPPLPSKASTTPFPIQAATLPDSLAGRDVLGRGRTGSGKTYAFLLPWWPGSPPATASARPAARGPDPGPHPRAGRADRRGAGTAGRGDEPALGHRLRRRRTQPANRETARRASTSSSPARPAGGSRESGHADLSAVEITVLDEADHMADLGFLPGGQAATGPHPAARPAAAVLRDTRRRCRRAGQALPARPGGAQRRLGAVAGIGDGASRAACRQRGAGRAWWPTWRHRPAAPSSSPAPSTARKILPAS